MRVNELANHDHAGQWTVDWSRAPANCDFSNPAAVVRAYKPWLQVNLCDVLRTELNEATYRDIMARIDPGFLQQGRRSREQYRLEDGSGPYYLRGISYQGFQDDTMVFFVTPSTEYQQRIKPPYYENLIQFLGWNDTGGDPNLTPREKASLLLWSSDLKLHCSDPSFVWWGYQYILTQLGASIVDQTIPPDVRNPELRGVVCKHLNRILHVLPFYNSDISKAIVAQWGGQIDKRALDAIRRRADIQRQVNQQNQELPPEQDIDDVMEPQPLEQEEPEVPPEEDNETPPTL
jgi:hypothetical protein